MYDFRKHLLHWGNVVGVWRQARELLAILALVLISNTAFAAPFYVPSGSMEPTLAIGDYIFASKFDYGYSRYSVPFGLGPQSDTRLLGKIPARGDVVVFRLPSNPSVTYVKRVIGLPGDHIQMREGRLYINDVIVPIKADGTANVEMSDGKSVPAQRFIETLPGGVTHPIYKWRDWPYDNTQEFVVPPGHLFMMGDNRDDSADSRVPVEYEGVGYVPMENLVAHARIVVGSYDFLNAKSVGTWLGQIRFSRFFHGIH